MSKFKSSMLIIGLLITVVAAALITFVSLSATGLIVADPIEITFVLRDANKEYDGTPLYASGYYIKSGELLEGDKEKVTFTRGITDFGTGDGEADVKILNEKGADVTSKYAITVEPAELTVSKRVISIEQAKSEKEYSGEVYYADEYSITSGELCYGHKIVTPANEIGRIDEGVTAGSGEAPTICDMLGNNVTKNYRINFTPGSITIIPRQITIAPVDASKVYDGTPLYAPACEIKAGSLLPGHKLDVVCRKTEGEDDEPCITDAGSATIEISSYLVTDVDGNDVSRNYAISGASATATLNIYERDLKIVGKSGSGRYNGQLQGLNTSLPESVVGLADGEEVTLTYEQFRDIKLHDNTFSYRITKTVDGEEADVNPDNYNINVVTGTYEITKGILGLKLKSVNLPYGEPMYGLGENTVAEYGDFNAESLSLLELSLPEGIYTNESENGKKYASVGVYGYAVRWAEYRHGTEEDPAMQDCYDVVSEGGTITVTPKAVVIELNPIELDYDPNFTPGGNKSLYDWGENGINAYKDIDSIPEAMRSLLEVKKPKEKDDKGNFAEAHSAGLYTYSVGFKDSVTEEVYSNYNLTVSPASYLIRKIDATVTVSDIKLTYSQVRKAKEDNKPITVNNEYFRDNFNGNVAAQADSEDGTDNERTVTFKYTAGGKEETRILVYGDYVVSPFTLTSSGTFYGSITLSEKEFGNYNVSPVSFKVEVSKGNLTVAYNGAKTKIYDGTPFEFNVSEFNTGDANLIVTSAVISNGAKTDANKNGESYEVKYKVTIKNAVTGEDETSNYIINDNRVLTDNITITKRNLYITGKAVTISRSAFIAEESPDAALLYEVDGLIGNDEIAIDISIDYEEVRIPINSDVDVVFVTGNKHNYEVKVNADIFVSWVD